MPESEASLRGYPSRRRMRQQRARKAGLASGRARRALADPAPRRVRQRQLALEFPVKIINRAEFDRRDGARRARAGLNPNERGTETLWREYLSCVRCYHAQGQGFLTTNGQRAEALRKAGRPRCTRTVRRAHAALADMGLLKRFHDRRGGSRAGNRDRLRVQLVPAFVPPPSAAQAEGLRPSSACAVPAVGRRDCAPDGRRQGSPAAPGSAAPPQGGGGGDQPALRPANGGGDEGEAALAGLDVVRTPAELALIRRLRERLL